MGTVRILFVAPFFCILAVVLPQRQEFLQNRLSLGEAFSKEKASQGEELPGSAGLSQEKLLKGEELSQQEETIPWSEDRKLQWSDFKGSYFKTEWAAATTATGIGYAFSAREQNGQQILEIDVNCEFFPQKSWYRPELCDSVILSHEQLHFDIAELHARIFRKRLEEFRFTGDIKAEVRGIYNQILKELQIFQNKYDRETDFSKNIQQQLLWNRTIAQELRVYN